MTTVRVRYIAAIYKLEFLGLVGLLAMILLLVYYCATKSDGSTEEKEQWFCSWCFIVAQKAMARQKKDKVGQNPDSIYIGMPEDCIKKKSFMGNMYMDGVY